MIAVIAHTSKVEAIAFGVSKVLCGRSSGKPTGA